MKEDLLGKEKTMHLNSLREDLEAKHLLNLKDTANLSEEESRKSPWEEMNLPKGKSHLTLNNPGQERKNKRKHLSRMPHQ
jgi:hypothetical protein